MNISLRITLLLVFVYSSLHADEPTQPERISNLHTFLDTAIKDLKENRRVEYTEEGIIAGGLLEIDCAEIKEREGVELTAPALLHYYKDNAKMADEYYTDLIAKGIEPVHAKEMTARWLNAERKRRKLYNKFKDSCSADEQQYMQELEKRGKAYKSPVKLLALLDRNEEIISDWKRLAAIIGAGSTLIMPSATVGTLYAAASQDARPKIKTTAGAAALTGLCNLAWAVQQRKATGRQDFAEGVLHGFISPLLQDCSEKQLMAIDTAAETVAPFAEQWLAYINQTPDKAITQPTLRDGCIFLGSALLNNTAMPVIDHALALTPEEFRNKHYKIDDFTVITNQQLLGLFATTATECAGSWLMQRLSTQHGKKTSSISGWIDAALLLMHNTKDQVATNAVHAIGHAYAPQYFPKDGLATNMQQAAGLALENSYISLIEPDHLKHLKLLPISPKKQLGIHITLDALGKIHAHLKEQLAQLPTSINNCNSGALYLLLAKELSKDALLIAVDSIASNVIDNLPLPTQDTTLVEAGNIKVTKNHLLLIAKDSSKEAVRTAIHAYLSPNSGIAKSTATEKGLKAAKIVASSAARELSYATFAQWMHKKVAPTMDESAAAYIQATFPEDGIPVTGPQEIAKAATIVTATWCAAAGLSIALATCKATKNVAEWAFWQLVRPSLPIIG